MEQNKKYLFYYNESKNLIGIRQHHWNWKEGDDITTDGVKTTIFGIFEGTEENEELAFYAMKALRRKYPFFRSNIYPETADMDDIDEVVDARLNDKIRKEFAPNCTWKNFDAKLDFVDAVLAEMN